MNRVRQCSIVVAVLVTVAFMIDACSVGNVSKGDAPDWYLNPPKSKDIIYGTGASEKMSSIDFAKKIADTNARQAIAATIQTSVQSMIRQYMQQSGTMEQARALQFAEVVSKSVVDVSLTGSVISKSEIRGGRCFSLAEMSKDSINNALLSAARDAAAEYSELKAKEAFDALEKEVKKGNY